MRFGRSRRSPPRRGVLMLVVLSLLVLFLLIGTAFLMTSDQSQKSAKQLAKKDRTGNYATKLLDRALLTLLRDTENPYSAARYHSLLRDLYGGDGYEAVVFRAEYAAASDPAFASTAPIGPTAGQLIDIYVATAPDPVTSAPAPVAAKIDRDPFGAKVPYNLSSIRGYYNGQLLTITGGAATGQSARIVDYEVIPDNMGVPIEWRLRVMAFPRSDGQPLVPDATNQLADLTGATFVVNGRALNGTGAGYNVLAQTGQPRLNAVEVKTMTSGDMLGMEVALTPNSAFLNLSNIGAPAPGLTNPFVAGLTAGPPDPFVPLNSVAVVPPTFTYPSYAGPGDTDESYDAPDYQNMMLAWQTVTPRRRGRYVADLGSGPALFDIDDPSVAGGQFLRFDLEDLPKPSFHDMALVNFWYHRLVSYLVSTGMTADDAVLGILQPFDPTTGAPNSVFSSPDQAALVASIKRKIMLRPSRDDHPKFDGGNPPSVPPVTPTLPFGSRVTPNPVTGDITINYPFWEIVGPWDVDNDGDLIPDSNWIDLGDPVQETENGTRYRTLYAVLILDLDSKLNVNAHGTAEHIDLSHLDLDVYAPPPGPYPFPSKLNLAHDLAAPPTPSSITTSDQLPVGSGYGPADISLRPIMPISPGALAGDPMADDYARLLWGRPANITPPNRLSPSVWGRDGSIDVWGNQWNVRPGMTYGGTPAAFDPATADPLAQLKFIGYPWWLSEYNWTNGLPVNSAYGTPPDLMGRYALGLDYIGQPVSEPVTELFNYGDRPLLMDSPYELDLTSRERKDAPDPAARAAMLSMVLAGVGMPLIDDAAFAAADLERILRAADADAGTLASRLWDVVSAFDPAKMLNDHILYVAQAATQKFGASAGNAEALATAQLLTSVNRHLVTTDSYDLPVPGQTMPGYVSQFGPDGAPGIALDDMGDPYDDDPDGDDPVTGGPLAANGIPNDASEVGAFGTDDFEAVTGRPIAQATIVDLLHYRVFLDVRKKYIQFQGWTEPLTLTQQKMALPAIYAQTAAILNGGQLAQTLLAPELIAGQRMDVNRPFGDGRDNNVNGVVDDPFEAGEPFLDLNGNGKRDDGTLGPVEPFIDLLPGDNDPPGSPYSGIPYDGPRDQLWPELNASGAIAEPITFDYLNGSGEPLHPAVGAPALANVRNLDSQGRQRFARHLYCLLLLLMDDNYLETPDVPSLGGDNINQEWLREAVAAEYPMAPPELIDEYVIRKLSARRIAQWAINCVDIRDADAVMTPFEYDENPWDGWGCLAPDPADPDPTNPTLPLINLPLDGDVATDENLGQVIDWSQVPQGRDPASNADDNSRVIAPSPATTTTPPLPAIPPIVPPPLPVNKTRGVVWGAERPELLITETLAVHDRRATDEATAASPSITNSSAMPPDYTLDQKLKPRGSMMVELYNPWSPDGQRPAEIYDSVDLDPNLPGPQPSAPGVMLNRLSDVGVQRPDGYKRSPVWRMAVLRDPVNGQLTNQVIDVTALNAPGGADEVESYATQFLSADPDGYGINMDQNAERFVYFTSGYDYTTGTGSDVNRADDNNIWATGGTAADYEQVGGPLVPTMTNLKVWVPPLPFHMAQNPATNQPQPYPSARRYFVARTERQLSNPPNDGDVPIAPILPGRYAVIGSSGVQLTGMGTSAVSTPDGGTSTRYVTAMSRLTSIPQTVNSQHVKRLPDTRRIELWPAVDPDIHQVLVGENGGPEFVRLGAGAPVNVTDDGLNGVPDVPLVDTDGDMTPDSPVIQPAVAIPVEDLNISEPVEGYPSRRYQELFKEKVPTETLSTAPPQLNADGELDYATAYDHPLDLAFELVRDGTTQNYRSVHLQRLANPMLPWNPLPIDDKGNANPLHQPNLPINPYLTIDSQSVDLTAFNGASTAERTLPSPAAQNDAALNIANDAFFQSDFFAPLPAGSLLDAPDHVLRALIYVLKKEGIIPAAQAVTPADFRTLITQPNSPVEGYLNKLEENRESLDVANRGLLLEDRWDDYDGDGNVDRDWGGEWGWALFRRILPDDALSGTQGVAGNFKQRLHLKSLERGSHDSVYYKYPDPPPPAAAVPEGWWYDTNWEPRLLWKQERPNVTLFLKGAAGTQTVKVTDLINAKSKRVLKGNSGPSIEEQAGLGADPVDEVKRNQAVWSQLKASIAPPNANDHVVDFVLEQTLGFANEAYAPELDRAGGQDAVAMMVALAPGAPEIATDPMGSQPVLPTDQKELDATTRRPSLYSAAVQADPTWKPAMDAAIAAHRKRLTQSTYPWLPWNNRPFASADELMQVPAGSSSLMLRDYSVINRGTPNPYGGGGLVDDGTGTGNMIPGPAAARLAVQQAPFGHLLNFFATAAQPAAIWPPPAAGEPIQLSGAPHYYRLLEYVQVPSRFVGTETVLSPDVFNDIPPSPANPTGAEIIGADILGPTDPRYLLQPPFNKVSRQRDPGKVNLNTVTSRRAVETFADASGNPIQIPRTWSEVFDGVMHRYHDSFLAGQTSHFGPAWRDVVLSRKSFPQFNANSTGPDDSVEKPALPVNLPPDVFSQGLNKDYPTFMANPFRSPEAGDLVPLTGMVRPGVDATWLRRHHFTRGLDGAWGSTGSGNPAIDDDDQNQLVNDARDAGFGDDQMATTPEESAIPLFSETYGAAFFDGERNPGMMYQPMTRMANLVTTRSNVFAIWITVGYFEVEPAPDWNDPTDADGSGAPDIQERFGGDINLYNRVYPEGYTLGKELGSDTGDVLRHRGFYIIDRTQEVGFKPGEDLNVEKMILLRRRID